MSSSSDDSGSSSVLSLSCSVSSVESDVSEVSEHGSNQETIEPYRFEPEESDTPLDTEETEPGGAEDSDDDDDDSEGEERLLNRDWCQCGNCVIMPTGRECVCCCEVESVVEKKEENHTDISCITDHEGFTPVCLDVWVLQTAYSNYRYHYGDPEEKHIHERYRFIAYRQLAGWCWGWLGRKMRVVLPSCAVNRIRTSFPSANYAGFKYPQVSNSTT